MDINFDAQLRTLDGRDIKLDHDTLVTLKIACLEALLKGRPEDANITGLPYKLYAMAQRINPGGVISLDASDRDMLKQRLELCWAVFPNIVGAAWDMLDGKSENNKLDTD